MSSVPTRDEIEEKVRSGQAWTEFCRVLEKAGEAVLAEEKAGDLAEAPVWLAEPNLMRKI